MKIEKISDTQIRCTLTSEDLVDRNLDIRELAYGSDKAKHLFIEMMQMASVEVGFDADGVPVMVEAIPSRDKGIVLVITKVEDPEEVDTRFARFSEAPSELKNPLEALLSMITEAVPSAATPAQQLASPPSLKKAYVFESLDAAIVAAQALNGDFAGKNSLYKNPSTGEFFLYLEEPGDDNALYLSTCNVLSEYAKVSLHNQQGTSYLNEHYELIIKDNALNALARI